MQAYSKEPLCRTNAAEACSDAMKATKVKINRLSPTQEYKQRYGYSFWELPLSKLLPSHTKALHTLHTPGRPALRWKGADSFSLFNILPSEIRTACWTCSQLAASPIRGGMVGHREREALPCPSAETEMHGFLLHFPRSVTGLILSAEISALVSRWQRMAAAISYPDSRNMLSRILNTS